MTIPEAINKAIEGGYPKERVEDLGLHVQAEYFLETTVLGSLSTGTRDRGRFEYIHLDREEPRKLRQPLWLYYWHRFTSHLVAGNTPASFVATFPSSSEAAR